MKSFFDVCFQYEIDSRRRRKASLTSVDALSLKLINSSKREGGGGERKGLEDAFGFDGRRYPSRWRMRPTSSSVDAVRGIGVTVAHIHPPAGVEAHSSAPPTRPYVDIDGADATLDVARSIVARDPR